MTDSEKRQLDETGYLVIENLMGRALLDQVSRRVDELFEQEGEQAPRDQDAVKRDSTS